MKDSNEVVYILYSANIEWDWNSNTYPAHDNPAFKWSPNFIPVTGEGDNQEPYHVWMKMKVGENDVWSNVMRITNPILASGEKGEKGDTGNTGDVGIKGDAGISIEVEYADVNKNPVSGTSNEVIFIRFKKDPITTSAWFKIVGSDAIMSATFPMGSNGQVLSTNGVAAIWIEKEDVYSDSDAQNAVIDDSQVAGGNITYSIGKLLTLFADGSLHNHDDRYYTETEMDAFLLGKEDTFSKNTGFNLDLGILAGTVAEGNHTHDDLYYTETEIDNLLALYYTEAELDAGQLNNLYYTETEIDATLALYYTIAELDGGQLDTRYYTETEINNLLDDYYTQLELATSGSALVHWDNLTDVPTMLHDDTSSVVDSSNTNFEVINNVGFDTYGHVTSYGSLNLANIAKDLNGALGVKIVARHNGSGDNVPYNPFTAEADSIDIKLDYNDLSSDSGNSSNPARNDHKHDLVYTSITDSAKALDVAEVADVSNVGTFRYTRNTQACRISIEVSMEKSDGTYEWYVINDRSIDGCTPMQ